MKREQQRKEKIRRQRKKRIMELMALGCHQALIARIMGVSKPTVGKLQVEMGVPSRFPVSRIARPHRKNAFATELVDEAAERFFSGQLPQDTAQLAKVMTNFPESVPAELKNKMTDEQWGQYKAHLTDGIIGAIRERENRRHVN
jgi:hypothetical protein